MTSVQVHARGTGAAFAYDTLRREILSSGLANLGEGALALRDNALLRVMYD